MVYGGWTLETEQAERRADVRPDSLVRSFVKFFDQTTHDLPFAHSLGLRVRHSSSYFFSWMLGKIIDNYQIII